MILNGLYSLARSTIFEVSTTWMICVTPAEKKEFIRKRNYNCIDVFVSYMIFNIFANFSYGFFSNVLREFILYFLHDGSLSAMELVLTMDNDSMWLGASVVVAL